MEWYDILQATLDARACPDLDPIDDKVECAFRLAVGLTEVCATLSPATTRLAVQAALELGRFPSHPSVRQAVADGVRSGNIDNLNSAVDLLQDAYAADLPDSIAMRVLLVKQDYVGADKLASRLLEAALANAYRPLPVSLLEDVLANFQVSQTILYRKLVCLVCLGGVLQAHPVVKNVRRRVNDARNQACV
jgi:hypothetical protein